MKRVLHSIFSIIAALVLALLFLPACGYKALSSASNSAYYICPIEGDYEGKLYTDLAEELAKSGRFLSSHKDAEYELSVAIVSNPIRKDEEEIGFRYAESPTKGNKMLVPSEKRQALYVSLSVIELSSGKCVLGPEVIRDEVDYDFDSDLFNDKVVNTPDGGEALVTFSLGQLENHEIAKRTASKRLSKRLASKIANYLLCKVEL